MTARLPHRRGRGHALALLIAMAVALLPAAPSGAAPGTAADPDDVALRLDLKAVSHANDSSTITYTAETYEDFPDRYVDFKWLIDTDGDGQVNLIVTTQWEDTEVVAGVDDPRERPVAGATVSRPAGNAIRVSIPTSVLKGVTAYDYRVNAISDLNDNGETDRDEQDAAPDSGWYHHSLAAATPPTGSQVASTTTTTASVPRSTPAPNTTSQPSTVTTGPTSSSPVGSSPAFPSPPTPSAAPPVTAPAPGAPAPTGSKNPPSVAGTSASRTPATPGAPAGVNPPLARTGRAHGRLAGVAAAMTLAGLGLRVLGSRPARRPRPSGNTTS